MKTNSQNLQVLYEDNHLLVVNKRAGDIVQGDKTGDKPLSEIAQTYLKKKYQKPGNVFLGVVHRIDRPTSGLVLFARTSKALSRLNKMLHDKKIEKTYWAIVKNKPVLSKATLIHYLKKNPKNNKTTVFDQPVPGAKKAIMHYRHLASSDNYHLLEIKLETGRPHQIRAQLSKIGSPIKGDLKYGFSRSNPDGGISLHARSVNFIHPVKKEPIEITAPLPGNDLWHVFKQV